MLTIHLNENNFLINQEEIIFPITIEKLILVLNASPRIIQSTSNTILVWDELGVTAYAKLNNLIDTIEISFELQKYEKCPKSLFKGQFYFKDKDAISYFFAHPELRVPIYEGDTHKALVAHNISAWFYGNLKQHQLNGISFSHYEAPPTAEALILDTQFRHLENLWKEWIDAIEQVVPKHNRYFNLKHGIQSQDIIDLQSIHDMEMPDILINFYKVHNVYWDAVTSAFQFHVNNWNYDLLPFQDIYKHWQNNIELNTEEDLDTSDYLNYDPRTKINDYTNTLWIPFAEGRNGDYLLIDLDPNENGNFGQIIELQNESWARNVIANSLEELIQMTIKQLKESPSEHYQFILENG